MADTKTTTTTNPGTTQQAAQPRQTSANTTSAPQPNQPVSTATRQPESPNTMRISEADAKGSQTATNDEPKQTDTLGISESEKNLTVEGATQEQPKEKGRITAESAKGLTIDEINHKLMVDSLDAPERNILEEQKKNLEEPDAPEIQNRDGGQPKEKEEKDGPFKEGDIIKYMYEEWLIAGANWLWKKGAENLGTGYFLAKQALQKAREEAAKTSGKTPDKTTQQKEKIDKYADNKSLTKTKEMEEHNKQFQKDIKAAMAGNYDETSFSPETKRFLENIPEHPDPNNPKRTKKDFLKDLGKNMENLRSNLTNIEQSSVLIAQAQMAAELHANPDAFKGADLEKLLDAYQKKAAILIAKQCDKEQKAGRDPTKFLNETLKTAQKARDRADANHDKGRYIENGKEPRDNPSLDKIKETLGWDKAPANDNQHNNEPKGLYQEAVDGKNAEQLMMGQLAQKDNELVASTKRRINNIDRRKKLAETYEKMLANLDRKENLTAQEQQQYANIQGKLAALSATGPVSGTVEADKKAQQIINKNEKQAQDKAVRNRQMAEMLGGMDR